MVLWFVCISIATTVLQHFIKKPFTYIIVEKYIGVVSPDIKLNTNMFSFLVSCFNLSLINNRKINTDKYTFQNIGTQ